MKIMIKFYQKFLMFIIFGSIIFIHCKKECAYDGKCYLPEDPRYLLNGSAKKECDGPCFAFKCLNYTTEITYGAGCYEEFVNACKWINPKIKEEFKGKNDSKYYDETALIVACEEGPSNCGILELETFEKGKEIEEHHGKTKNSKGGCNYDDKPLPNLEKRICTTFQYCQSSADENATLSSIIKVGVTECTSPCTVFQCVSEENHVFGSGCYEEFERICTIIPSEALTQIRANKKNHCYFDENVVMVSCTNRNNCSQYNFEAYVGNNKSWQSNATFFHFF